jgi:hypothetical protein
MLSNFSCALALNEKISCIFSIIIFIISFVSVNFNPLG